MSLINDALKRAKVAQQNAAPVTVPLLQLRPIEPDPSPMPERPTGRLLPVGIVLATLVVLFFAWPFFQSGNPPQVVTAKARSAAPVSAVPAARATVSPSAPAPNSRPGITVAAAPQELSPAPVPLQTTGSGTAPTETVATQTEAAAPPAPPPLRLQAIIFNPRHPSAVLNGRTVFLGDRCGSFRVARISRTSVTLIGPGQTNLLELLQ